MRRLTSIVAMARHGAIGAGNRLPWRVKSDLQFFRESTSGHTVIMGRRTKDSLGGCLPNRNNIVVTHGFDLFAQTQTCRCSGSIIEALALSENTGKFNDEVFIIGGATMYEQFAPYIDRYLITYIDKHVEGADTFFDQRWLGDDSRWQKTMLKTGYANSSGDEANFEIFEYVAKDVDDVRRRRNEAIQRFKAPSRRRLDHSTQAGVCLIA